jgi:hypothetical protein
MRKDTSKNRKQSGNKGRKENREDFGFYIGIDYGTSFPSMSFSN